MHRLRRHHLKLGYQDNPHLQRILLVVTLETIGQGNRMESRPISVRLSEDELVILDKLSHGKTRSETIRKLIKEAAKPKGQITYNPSSYTQGTSTTSGVVYIYGSGGL